MAPRFLLTITSGMRISTKSGPIPGIPQTSFINNIGVVRILIYCSYYEILEN